MITLLSAGHYPEIINIWEESVRATHSFLKPSEIEFYRPLVMKYGLPATQLFGYSKEKVLCGFIGVRKNKIEMLFIAPAYFNQGIGSKLLSYAIKELGCQFVDVNEENPRAFSFYKKHGFKLLSRDDVDDCGKPHPILHLSL